MKISYPMWVKEILNILLNNNYEAYLVGGCVRDALLNRPTNDYDITTNALPQQITELFVEEGYTIIPTGLVHGTLTILKYKNSVEITTYRIDNEYVNNRKPKKVSFSSSLYEDLKRRDFTINAMAYNDVDGLIDPMNGLTDLNNKVIKAVGNAPLRFNEDALRILRCIRFSCILNFKIDTLTSMPLKSSYYLLNNISKERIRDELCKILLSDKPDILIILREYKILELLIPEYATTYEFDQNNKWHIYNLFDHMNIALNSTKGLPLTCKLAILLHDLGKPASKSTDDRHISHFYMHAFISSDIARRVLNELKFDNATVNEVCTIITYHDYYLKVDRRVLRKFLNKLNNNLELAYKIMDTQIADDKAKNLKLSDAKITILNDCKDLLHEMEKDEDIIGLKELQLNGNDLVKLGFNGKDIGNILEYLLNQVIRNPALNNTEDLIKLIKLKKGQSFSIY